MIGRFLAPSLAACLALCLVAELAAGPGATPDAPQAIVPVLPPPASFKAVFAQQWAAAILARPLFQTDRRPIPAAAAAVVDDTLPRLSAIVITGAGRVAVFDGADGALAVGGRIGAYQLRTIGPDSVSLIGPDGTVNVHPEYTGLSGNENIGTAVGAVMGAMIGAPTTPQTSARFPDGPP